VESGETERWQAALLVLSVGGLLVLGLSLPAPVAALLNQCVSIVSH
jgi:hypothetical protein